MALVNYTKWQRLAVAILDRLVDDELVVPRKALIEDVVFSTEEVPVRVEAMLDKLAEFGAVRHVIDSSGDYYMANTVKRKGVRAMRDVWEGRFDGK